MNGHQIQLDSKKFSPHYPQNSTQNFLKAPNSMDSKNFSPCNPQNKPMTITRQAPVVWDISLQQLQVYETHPAMLVQSGHHLRCGKNGVASTDGGQAVRLSHQASMLKLMLDLDMDPAQVHLQCWSTLALNLNHHPLQLSLDSNHPDFFDFPCFLHHFQHICRPQVHEDPRVALCPPLPSWTSLLLALLALLKNLVHYPPALMALSLSSQAPVGNQISSQFLCKNDADVSSSWAGCWGIPIPKTPCHLKCNPCLST